MCSSSKFSITRASGVNVEKVKELAWHYTTAKSYEAIKESGVLLPSSPKYMGKNEKPILWFSSHPHYDVGASGFFRGFGEGFRRLTLEEMLEKHGVLVRLGVPTERVIPWRAGKLATVAKMPKKAAQRLKMVGLGFGANPSKHWYGSVEPIPFEECKVEQLVNAKGQWEIYENSGGETWKTLSS